METITVEDKINLSESIDKYLNDKEDKIRERTYFYVSEVGKTKKEIYENFKNPKSKKFEARIKRILDNGDYMHMRFFKYFIEMGMLIAAEVTAVENDLVHGRCDAIISDKKQLYIVDLKSCSQWTFNKLKEIPHDYKLQILFYMYYLKIPRGIILFENKDNQSMKEFYIEMTEENRKIVEDKIEELKQLKEMINNNIIPIDEPMKLEDLQY